MPQQEGQKSNIVHKGGNSSFQALPQEGQQNSARFITTPI